MRRLHPARVASEEITPTLLTLTLFTGGDRRVPPAPKLAPRLLRALQGITKIAFEDSDGLKLVHGLQPSCSPVLNLWSFAADCWKTGAQRALWDMKPTRGSTCCRTLPSLDPTFTAWPGPAPGSLSGAAEGRVLDEGVSVLAAVLNHRAYRECVRGLAAVLPVGNAGGEWTPHLCGGERDEKSGNQNKPTFGNQRREMTDSCWPR